MNVPHNSPDPNPTTLRLLPVSWLVPLVVVPLVIFAGYVGWLLFNEYRSYRQLDTQMIPIRAPGASPEDAWLTKQFAEVSSSEGTAAWSQIIMLSGSVGWNAINDLPIIGHGKTLRTLEVGAQWESQKLVDDYLHEAQPLLELIYEAEKYPTPVWQPMDFRGYSTLLPELQDSRQIARVLQLDFEHAVVGNDRQRAMRNLQAMQNTADAFDWDLFMVGELVNVALRGMRYIAIQRSLYADIWTVDDLEQLMAEAQQPLPLAQSWRRSIESEKAMAATFTLGPLYSPSNRLRLLERYAEMEALANSDPGQFVLRAGELERHWKVQKHGLDFMFAMLQPAITAYAAAFDRLEHTRRLVLTSLAVKLFKVTNERWPEDLQELTQLGLKSADWTLPGIGPLGYAVEADGETACVWGVDVSKSRAHETPVAVSDECPDYSGEELDKVQHFLTVIK